MTEHPFAFPAANHCAWREYQGSAWTAPLEIKGLECNDGFTRGGKEEQS